MASREARRHGLDPDHNGWRGETDTQEKIQRRVEHDFYYIENWSVTFDLYILLVTTFALLKGDAW